MKIYFIRHGHTTGDIEDRYGGIYDDALSPEGEKQVEELVAELTDSGIKAIYCSPLLRARQTAKALADKLNCPIVLIDDLKERNQYGPLTGMVKAEAKQQYPDLVELAKDRLNTLPDAESYAQASARTSAAVAEIAAKQDACAAIIWHGGGMRVLFRDILKAGELKEIGNCSWVMLERQNADEDFQIKDQRHLIFDF